MNPLRRYPILASLLRPFRLSQQKTCAALVVALCQAAQASSFAIAGQLACLTEVQFGSALTRLYRFLRNERFDNWLLTERMLQLLAQPDKSLLLALDWTARPRPLLGADSFGVRWHALDPGCGLCLCEAQPLPLTKPVGRNFPAAGGGAFALSTSLSHLAM